MTDAGVTVHVRIGRLNCSSAFMHRRSNAPCAQTELAGALDLRTATTKFVSKQVATKLCCIFATYNNMRESLHNNNVATEKKGAVVFDVLAGDVVAPKTEMMDDNVSPQANGYPQASQEDRHDVFNPPSTSAYDDDIHSVPSRDGAAYQENCLESAPSMDALALSCILYTKDEEIKQLHAELKHVRNQLKDQEALSCIVDSTSKLEETVGGWNRELLLKQGRELLHVAEIEARDRAINRLKDDLARAGRRVSELEVKLEFHDFKFVSYEKYSSQAGRKNSSDTGGKRAGRSHADKLVSDLEEIERLYISAKSDFAKKSKHLEQKCIDYQAKCLSLENALSSTKLPPHAISDQLEESGELEIPIAFMRKKMTLLESELQAHNLLTASLQTRLEEVTTSFNTKEKDQRKAIKELLRSKTSLENKVIALQNELNFGHEGVQNADYAPLTEKMEEMSSEIARLEARLRTKDRIISKLKEKLSNTEQGVRSSAGKHLAVICEPLPNNFTEVQREDRRGRKIRLDDEPSI
jgi:hypothetical protein